MQCAYLASKVCTIRLIGCIRGWTDGASPSQIAGNMNDLMQAAKF